jgi:1-acyl-sn-glycerol-3-phosphate acyltransferase
MRQVVRDGDALGLFVEGTRQRAGVPGRVQPGAAMVALQEGVPIVPAAIHGTETWTLRERTPVSVAWGAPMHFEGLPKGGKAYREVSDELERELRKLWDWLAELHGRGRPRHAVPPA